MFSVLQSSSWFKLTAAAGLTAAIVAFGATPSMSADLGEGDPEIESEPESVRSKAWYVSVFGGGNFITDNVGFTNGITTDDTDFDSGFTLGGAVGYRWHNARLGWLVPRTEFEVNYSENDVDTLDFSGNGIGNEVVNSDSNVSSVSFLANLFFDAPNAFGNGITPYFGGGIGVSVVNHDIIYNAVGANLSDTDSAFTWHLTAGASIDINDSASVFADIGYHQIVDAGSIRRIGVNPAGGAGGGRFEDDIDSVVAKVGVRVNF